MSVGAVLCTAGKFPGNASLSNHLLFPKHIPTHFELPFQSPRKRKDIVCTSSSGISPCAACKPDVTRKNEGLQCKVKRTRTFLNPAAEVPTSNSGWDRPVFALPRKTPGSFGIFLMAEESHKRSQPILRKCAETLRRNAPVPSKKQIAVGKHFGCQM